ncbi:class I SAM-dependent methyltransferase [Heyndrickxia oleronia]|uniref:class I SAM-dependent methyltransferase n=1 Tax=Heyndrickxia oleronia TaxID=38875 RepID=UPI001B2CC153|nr:class I SAM-dependent methyltransferase [Heyndrickxia oleronia]GIN41091.1 ubiquinone biosynthesis methyltransferase UbiE [Heyndrickxia oleronia]
MKEQIKRTFNQLAHAYENSVDKVSLHNREYERPSMLRNIPNNIRNMRVLDAGCAAGWYTEQLSNRGASVVATDLSPDMVAATKRRVKQKAEVVCVDLEKELPFDDNSFDMIISSLTLHYIKDWEKTFGEFQRILKSNGVFLYSVHHPFMDIHISQNEDYFANELLIDRWNKEGKIIEVLFYRRPLNEMINVTTTHFIIEKVIEPQPTQAFKTEAPEKYEKLMKKPHFIIVKAINKKRANF